MIKPTLVGGNWINRRAALLDQGFGEALERRIMAVERMAGEGAGFEGIDCAQRFEVLSVSRNDGTAGLDEAEELAQVRCGDVGEVDGEYEEVRRLQASQPGSEPA